MSDKTPNWLSVIPAISNYNEAVAIRKNYTNGAILTNLLKTLHNNLKKLDKIIKAVLDADGARYQ